MEAITALASACKAATAYDHVHKSECVYTFHTPLTNSGSGGLVVNLQTFVGTVLERALAPSNAGPALFLRIVQHRQRKAEMPSAATTAAPPTKLGLGVEGGFTSEEDKYEIISTYSVLVLERAASGETKVVTEVPYTTATSNDFPTSVAQSVDAIVHHVGVATQQDVAVWSMEEPDIPVSKYAADLPFVANGVVIDPDPKTWKCAASGATENLWLNLSDGYIGGGRQHWDGTGGSNGALDHFRAVQAEGGGFYPLVVKLGTITSDVSAADCYSYAPDEDGPVRVPNLAALLEQRGMRVHAGMRKTVKSTAELEVELNANYAFDAITEAGGALTPVSGPGQQGLQNLGNSCYMNSVVQMLFSGTVPELSKRYGTTPGGSLTEHALLQAVLPAKAAEDVLCQTTKLTHALTSGVFAKPVADMDEEDSNDPKYRLAPRMLKHAVARNHVDFRTGQQQDAAQFLQYYLEQLDRAEMASSVLATAAPLPVASDLFAFQTTARMVCQGDAKVKYKESAAETLWSLRIPMDKAIVSDTEDVTSPEQKRLKADDSKEDDKPIPRIGFATCVAEWASETTVDDIQWPHLQNAKHAASQKLGFTNFPRYLLVQMQRYTLGPDWSPIKLEVNLDIPEEIDLTAYKSHGPADGEDLVPSEDDTAAAVPTQATTSIDEGAVSQLMDMGFSLNSCKRALTAVGGSNVEAAMGWVFEHNTDPDFNDPLPEGNATTAAASTVDEGVVQSLVESLGCFTADQVRAALEETNGAADRAADWLFSHMDDLDGAIASLQASKAGGGGAAGSSSAAPKVPLEDSDTGKYVMTGMISHIGKNTGSGHYVAHLKKEGQWVIFNDEKVALSSSPPLPHAYLYLFQRADTVGAPRADY